jgi:hypothetical protein
MDMCTLILYNRNPCCNKNIIKSIAYKLCGIHVADRTCHILCINLFLLYVFVIDIIWHMNVISIILDWCFPTYIPGIMINLLSRAINVTLLLTISSEVKLLFNTFTFKCEQTQVHRSE